MQSPGNLDIDDEKCDLANALIKLGALPLICEATTKAPNASVHHPGLVQRVNILEMDCKDG